jgi:phosphate/sulfate permease
MKWHFLEYGFMAIVAAVAVLLIQVQSRSPVSSRPSAWGGIAR